LTVGGLMGDPIIAVGLFGVTGALIWLFHTGWMLSMGGVSLRTGLQTLGHVAIMLAVPISAPLTALAMGASQIVLVASVVVGGLIYAVIAVRSGVLSENGESV